MNQSQKPQRSGKPKLTPAYRKNKKAFDAVILHLRRMDRPCLGHVGAVDFERASGGPRNPSAPNSVEFRADVLLAIRAAMPKGVKMTRFILAYLLYDSEDEIERNTYAEKILGGRVHSVEQRIGSEFVRRAIWPIPEYMFPVRTSL